MLNLLKNYHTQEDLTDRYNTLCNQGIKYQKTDYLSHVLSISIEDTEGVVDERCRQIMVKWCYKITNHCNYSPETACSAIYLLDKFLSKEEGRFVLCDRRTYQLALVCCLRLTIKMHEIKKMDMSSLAKLCRGFYDNDEFTQMEHTILSSLQWYMCPPTPYTHLELLLDLLPPSDIDNCRRTTRKLAHEQIFNSVQDYFFVTIDPSFIALSSILNALEDMKFPSDALFSFLHNVIIMSGMDCTNPMIAHLRYRLSFSGIIHDQGATCISSNIEKKEGHTRSASVRS